MDSQEDEHLLHSPIAPIETSYTWKYDAANRGRWVRF